MLIRETVLIVIAVVLSNCLYEAHNISSLTFIPIVISADYGREYNLLVNNNTEYILSYPIVTETWVHAARVEIESNATHDAPLLVVVHQKKNILSWQIPLLIDSEYFGTSVYNKTSRTVCSTRYCQSTLTNFKEALIVSLNTESHTNISFKLSVTKNTNFTLRTGVERSVQISPSEPIYYNYIFSKEISSSVIVHVHSDSDICMTLAIQNATCPVFDLETNIKYSDYWQTVNRQGGIIVPKDAYPLGFFVILSVKGDDTDCSGAPSRIPLRNKEVTITINASITKRDFLTALGIMTAIIFIFCLTYIICIVLSKIKEGRKIKLELLNSQECGNIDEPVPSSSRIEVDSIMPHQSLSIDEDSSLDEDDIDYMEDTVSDKEIIRTKLVLSVCDLARKDPKILKHKSLLYLYYLVTVAIFYTLPVVQLVITYQHVLHVTGNQDMCYYNFLCSHPLGVLSDFNHVYSNIGYVMLGFLFIYLTYSRENNELERERSKCYGIPQHYGLFYAMGTALIMEGILSGSYHVCPNRSNFQFDTSFMYIIAVLSMIKVYQTRHPDINARAPITFGVLALIIIIELIGDLNGSAYFWSFFTAVHLLSCLFLTIQIYYMGRWKIRNLSMKLIQNYKQNVHCGMRSLFQPLYLSRCLLLVMANLCNIGLAVYGNIRQESNFATYLLAILMSNLILYIFFYIVMKICHKERILFQPFVYIILSITLWAASLYFFRNKSISWSHTPAQSRLYNKSCELLTFFDSHDIWHFLSAFAMFFSFMVLLTLDDDLIDVHRSQIPVF